MQQLWHTFDLKTKVNIKIKNIRATVWAIIDQYRFLLFHYYAILPYLVKRTLKIWDGNTL